jgi:signal transduction histidine kinase
LYRLTQNFLLYAEIELTAIDPQRVKALRHTGDKSETPKIIVEVALQKARTANREADLHLELQEAIIRISESRFQKIIEEIVDNAFKFSPPGTPVRLFSTLTENTFKLCVIDSGRGMTQEQIASLGAYMQFERKLYEQQGSGLGLSLAKRLIELYGGKLTIDSFPEQQTSVQITLPMEMSDL